VPCALHRLRSRLRTRLLGRCTWTTPNMSHQTLEEHLLGPNLWQASLQKLIFELLYCYVVEVETCVTD
jgi:hypothetical protein